jgi:hypothetical protein
MAKAATGPTSVAAASSRVISVGHARFLTVVSVVAVLAQEMIVEGFRR